MQNMQLLLLAASVLSSTLLCGCGGGLWTEMDADGIESSRSLRLKKKQFPLNIRRSIDYLADCLAESLDPGTRLCIDAAPAPEIEYQPSFKHAEGSDEAYIAAIRDVADWLQPGTSICIKPDPDKLTIGVNSGANSGANAVKSGVNPVTQSSLDYFVVKGIHDSQLHFKFDMKAVSDIIDASGRYDEYGGFAGKDETATGFNWNTVIMKHTKTKKEIIGNLAVDRTSKGANNDDTFGNFGCYQSHSKHDRCGDAELLTVGDLRVGDELQIISVCARYKNGEELLHHPCIELQRP